jgi:hypothetical protein
LIFTSGLEAVIIFTLFYNYSYCISPIKKENENRFDFFFNVLSLAAGFCDIPNTPLRLCKHRFKGIIDIRNTFLYYVFAHERAGWQSCGAGVVYRAVYC